jgi:hypothetical protein
VVKRIFAWATDGAGCYFYRLQLPLLHLPKERFSVDIGAPGPDIHGYDVVIGQRLAFNSPLWNDLCADPNVMTVYDIDDDLMNIDPENAVPHSIYAPLRDIVQHNIKISDVVTASTPKLAEYLRQFNANVHVLRNCVPDALVETPRRARHGLTIGWGGSMFHGQDWGPMNKYLRHIQRRHGVALRCVGANYMTGLTNVSTVGFIDVNSYHQELDFHIGIAPLINTPFNQRKSWIKTLEYAARGIPVVASNVGQYGEWIDHGRNGYLVDDLRDGEGWTSVLEALIDDNTRTELGENALAKARMWTIGQRVNDWAHVYDQ